MGTPRPGFAGVVTDVNVKIRFNHTYVGDLSVSLVGPDGTTVALAYLIVGLGAFLLRGGPSRAARRASHARHPEDRPRP